MIKVPIEYGCIFSYEMDLFILKKYQAKLKVLSASKNLNNYLESMRLNSISFLLFFKLA